MLDGGLDLASVIGLYPVFKDTKNIFEKIWHRIRGSPKDWNKKGIEFFKQGKCMEAVRCFCESIEKYFAAVRCFDKAIELDPDVPQPWFNKGSTLLILNTDYEEASRCFDKALSLNTEHDHIAEVDAWINNGFALLQLKKVDDSAESLDKAISWLKPKLALAFNNKGLTLCAKGEYQEAIRYFDEARRLEPGLVMAQKNKEMAQEEMKRKGGEARR